jgi:hypothetical protein
MNQVAPPYLDDIKLPLTNGHLFKILDDQIPKNILTFLTNKINHLIENVVPDAIFKHDQTVLSQANYIKKEYNQWYMQKKPDYTTWIDPEFQIITDYVTQWVDDITEFKFSMTSPETDISWHVLHPLPRIHIPLSDESCLFDVVDGKQKMYTYELERGKIYMLNVCYPHRVRNVSTEIRKQAFFTFSKLK